MSDDLPNQNDLSNTGGVTPSQTAVPEVPNTPNSPNIPNPPNTTIDPVQSWVAQHEQRDTTGKFIKSDHVANDQPSHNNSNPSTPSNPSNSLNLPPLIQTNTGTSDKNSKGDYPPLFQIANPVTYLKIFWNKVMKNEGVKIGFNFTVKPVTAVMIALALTGAYGAGYHVGITDAAKIFFPNSSPILHRAISLQGTIQRSETGQYYLSLPDNTLWTLKPTSDKVNLSNYIYKQVVVKGNLTAEANVINVNEVIAFDNKPTPVIYTPPQPAATNSAQLSH